MKPTDFFLLDSWASTILELELINNQKTNTSTKCRKDLLDSTAYKNALASPNVVPPPILKRLHLCLMYIYTEPHLPFNAQSHLLVLKKVYTIFINLDVPNQYSDEHLNIIVELRTQLLIASLNQSNNSADYILQCDSEFIRPLEIAGKYSNESIQNIQHKFKVKVYKRLQVINQEHPSPWQTLYPYNSFLKIWTSFLAIIATHLNKTYPPDKTMKMVRREINLNNLKLQHEQSMRMESNLKQKTNKKLEFMNEVDLSDEHLLCIDDNTVNTGLASKSKNNYALDEDVNPALQTPQKKDISRTLETPQKTSALSHSKNIVTQRQNEIDHISQIIDQSNLELENLSEKIGYYKKKFNTTSRILSQAKAELSALKEKSELETLNSTKRKNGNDTLLFTSPSIERKGKNRGNFFGEDKNSPFYLGDDFGHDFFHAATGPSNIPKSNTFQKGIFNRNISNDKTGRYQHYLNSKEAVPQKPQILPKPVLVGANYEKVSLASILKYPKWTCAEEAALLSGFKIFGNSIEEIRNYYQQELKKKSSEDILKMLQKKGFVE